MHRNCHNLDRILINLNLTDSDQEKDKVKKDLEEFFMNNMVENEMKNVVKNLLFGFTYFSKREIRDEFLPFAERSLVNFHGNNQFVLSNITDKQGKYNSSDLILGLFIDEFDIPNKNVLSLHQSIFEKSIDHKAVSKV